MAHIEPRGLLFWAQVAQSVVTNYYVYCARAVDLAHLQQVGFAYVKLSAAAGSDSLIG